MGRGRDRSALREVLGLESIDEGDGGAGADTNGDASPTRRPSPAVRLPGKWVAVNAEGDLPAKAVADVSPGPYDDDALAARLSSPGGPGQDGSRRRHLFAVLSWSA